MRSNVYLVILICLHTSKCTVNSNCVSFIVKKVMASSLFSSIFSSNNKPSHHNLHNISIQPIILLVLYKAPIAPKKQQCLTNLVTSKWFALVLDFAQLLTSHPNKKPYKAYYTYFHCATKKNTIASHICFKFVYTHFVLIVRESTSQPTIQQRITKKYCERNIAFVERNETSYSIGCGCIIISSMLQQKHVVIWREANM